MLLDDVLEDLRHVENGGRLMDKPLAGRAVDTIEMLVEINRGQEEQLAHYKELEIEGRLKVRPPVEGRKCGTCGNYDIIPGTAYGYCKVRKDKHRPQKQLYVGRRRVACKDNYQKKK